MEHGTLNQTPLPVEDDLVRARRKQAAVRELIRKTVKDVNRIRPTMEDTPEAREAWDLAQAWRQAQTAP